MRELPQYVRQLGLSSLQPVQISTAQAQATKGISAELAQIGTDIHARGLEITAVKANADMLTTLQRQFDEYGSDPTALAAAQDQYRTGLQQLPSEIRDKAIAQWDIHAQNYRSKSTQNLWDSQDNQLKIAFAEGLDKMIRTGKSAVPNIDSNVPEWQRSAYMSLGSMASAIDYMKTARKRDGRPMWSPSEVLSIEHTIQSKAEAAAKAAQVAPIDKAIAEDPDAFIANPDGFGIKWKNEEQRTKAITDAMAARDTRQKIADVTRIIAGEQRNQDLLNVLNSGSPEVFAAAEDARENGADPIFIDHVLDRARKIVRVPQAQKDELYTSIADRTNAIGVKGSGEDITVSKDVSLEEVVRLQSDINKAEAMGITGLGRFKSQVGKALIVKAKNETGVDDPGFGFGFSGRNDPPEEYDAGYEAIDKFLRSRDITSAATRSDVIRRYVNKMDAAPDDVRKDAASYNAYQVKVANAMISQVVADTVADKTNHYIPIQAIKKLMANRGLRAAFDEQFGEGSAAKVLGE